MCKAIPAVAYGFFAMVIAAMAAPAQSDSAGAPLTPALVEEIRKSNYADESVQTTNGNVVGIFTQIVSNKAGQPVLGVIQAYDNVTRSKQFVAVPWPLFRYDEASRRIQIQAAADQLREAPKFQQNQIAGLAEGPELQKIQQHFGATGGMGAAAGSQSGRGSSATLIPPATNEAQPGRGSVGIMYVLGALALVVAGVGFVLRRRT